MRDNKRANRLHVARRTTIYIVTVILLAVAGILVCVLAFLTAERYSNLYILATEGMSLRAETTLNIAKDNIGDSSLQDYFLESFLLTDEKLTSDTYKQYTVNSFDYDLSIENITVYPWSETATVTAVEKIRMKGEINPEYLEQNDKPEDFSLPEWEPSRMKISFVNLEGRWYIARVDILEYNPSDGILGTPDLNQSILPMATPTPSPQLVDFNLK